MTTKPNMENETKFTEAQIINYKHPENMKKSGRSQTLRQCLLHRSEDAMHWSSQINTLMLTLGSLKNTFCNELIIHQFR